MEDELESIEYRLEQALKEVKLMQEGKLPKRNWREMMKELREELESKSSSETQEFAKLTPEQSKSSMEFRNKARERD